MGKDDFLRSIASWAPGDHHCCLYEGEAEHKALIIPLLRLGLERGQKVLYLVDSRTAHMVVSYLRDEGLDVESYLESGQLTMLTTEDAYIRNGRFDPDEMIAFLRGETERALAQGYTALRVSGEMTWVLGERSGSDRLIEYESKLDTFITGSKCLAVCQYDRRRFEADRLLEVVVAHPVLVTGTHVRQNLYYIPPVHLLSQNRALSALDHWLEQLAAHEKSKEALERSEARFRTIFERAAIGISLVDAEGRIITSNPGLQRMLGYTEEELRGMRFTELTYPADVESNASLFQDLMAGELDYYRIEKRYVHKDGHIVWGHLTASAVRDAEGKPQFGIGMVKDITERKRMEAELAELQHRLIESREAERLYLAQELHDGPLQVLIGATYQLGELGDVLPDEQSLGQMVAAQASLQRVIRMLRTAAGQLRPPALAPFGLARAIRSHAEEFRQEHPELDIQLDLTSDNQTLPEQMRLALFRIYQQALQNVVRHARAGRVQIRFELNMGLVILEIQDDGRGFIVPGRWIELARQGHLGLVGMSERAEAIGGRLELRSAPGEGTLIRVVAPYSEIEA
jgi:PAS domain S-box-containing protein